MLIDCRLHRVSRESIEYRGCKNKSGGKMQKVSWFARLKEVVALFALGVPQEEARARDGWMDGIGHGRENAGSVFGVRMLQLVLARKLSQLPLLLPTTP